MTIPFNPPDHYSYGGARVIKFPQDWPRDLQELKPAGWAPDSPTELEPTDGTDTVSS